jgi:hypothetical protein
MIEWILNNKEWLFSGAGVAIIILLVGWVVNTVRSRSTKSIPADTPAIENIPLTETVPPTEVIPFDQRIFLTRPLPKDIRDQIKSAPLVHQVNRAQEFVGLKIQWKTCLRSVYTVEANMLRLMLAGEDEYPPFIYCDVPQDLYPDLLLAHEGTVIWIAGKIAECKILGIKIQEPQLSFQGLITDPYLS